MLAVLAVLATSLVPFAATAQRMGRSEDAIEKLWLRALGRLRREMGEQA